MKKIKSYLGKLRLVGKKHKLLAILVVVVLVGAGVYLGVQLKKNADNRKNDQSAPNTIPELTAYLRKEKPCDEGITIAEAKGSTSLQPGDKDLLLKYLAYCSFTAEQYDKSLRYAQELLIFYDSPEGSNYAIDKGEIQSLIEQVKRTRDSEKSESELEEQSKQKDDGYDGPYL